MISHVLKACFVLTPWALLKELFLRTHFEFFILTNNLNFIDTVFQEKQLWQANTVLILYLSVFKKFTQTTWHSDSELNLKGHRQEEENSGCSSTQRSD